MANPNLCLCWMVDSIGFCGSPFFPTETNLIPMKSWHSRRLFEIQAQSTNDGNHLCLVCVWVCECAVQFYLLKCSWLFSGVFCIVLQFCIVSVSGQSLSWYNWPNVFARDDIIFVGRIFDIGFFFFFFRSVVYSAHNPFRAHSMFTGNVQQVPKSNFTSEIWNSKQCDYIISPSYGKRNANKIVKSGIVLCLFLPQCCLHIRLGIKCWPHLFTIDSCFRCMSSMYLCVCVCVSILFGYLCINVNFVKQIYRAAKFFYFTRSMFFFFLFVGMCKPSVSLVKRLNFKFFVISHRIYAPSLHIKQILNGR